MAGGFLVAELTGIMADEKTLRERVYFCLITGPGLAFIAYPEGLAMMPVAPLWSCMFFLMLFTLGIDSQFASIEAIVTAMVDEFPQLKKGGRKTMVILIACVSMFLFGLPQCSRVSICNNYSI